MYINDLLQEKNMSKYKLAKESGVPQTTIADICSGKAKVSKCSVDTIYKIAKVLDVTMEALVEPELGKLFVIEHRTDFNVFRSNVCHLVKDLGDIDFIMETLENDIINQFHRKKWYQEAYYMLAMVDYLSRVNEIPICSKYDELRLGKLEKVVYPEGVVLSSKALESETILDEAEAKAIPEFMKFNIIENEIRDIS